MTVRQAYFRTITIAGVLALVFVAYQLGRAAQQNADEAYSDCIRDHSPATCAVVKQ